eukprot:COSAG03_NODE_26073_length_261_cov_1.277778_1_plen_59_part_10
MLQQQPAVAVGSTAPLRVAFCHRHLSDLGQRISAPHGNYVLQSPVRLWAALEAQQRTCR